MTILYDYQRDGLEKMIEKSKLLLLSKKEDKYILLKAITGAGKTVIASEYVNKLIEVEGFENTAFVWVSIGKGGLHTQSKDSLKDLSSKINVKTVNEALTEDRLNPNDLMVVNWEALNTKKKNKDTGLEEFDNIAMRNGEKRNLPTLWGQTRNSGTNIVLIIDESHMNAKSESSKQIVSLIKPIFSLEITATPRKDRMPSQDDAEINKAFYIKINTQKVIEEGIIKKSIRLNDSFVRTDENSKELIDGMTELMIKSASEKRIELLNAYKSEDVLVNPLCLIQLPDGKVGETYMNDVLEVLKSINETTENGQVAIWTSDEKVNLETIKSPLSNVNFLLFKQAVATGWDCPRAAILVKLREPSKSSSFDTQTIGRILRSFGRKHYKNDILNHGYIYTDSKYTINADDYSAVLPKRQVLKEEFKDDINAIKLTTERLIKEKSKIDDNKVKIEFKKLMDSHDLNIDVVRLGEAYYSQNIDVEEIYNLNEKGSIDTSNAVNTEYTLSSKDINREYKRLLMNKADSDISYEVLGRIAREYIKTRYKIADMENLTIKKIYIKNQKIINQVWNEIRKKISNKSSRNFSEPEEFKFPNERFVSDDKKELSCKKSAYHKHFESKYMTEQIFEAYLETLDSVKCWVKNTDGGDGLSVGYECTIKVNGISEHSFYPDYIVLFNNGTIGVYEVKDKNDRDKATISRDKIDALRKRCENWNKSEKIYKCGLVEIVKENNNADVYIETLPPELKY